ncbi:ataxin-1-like [Micropterus dolomieu]|uniref:ataxin-1-like n=1 Tax=Micropterus dolomieu TaxID=147949 RepID=UPI001E8DD36B|nr:ataxin-1-like [Micropterus dolomieu]XP_045900684.1 ataxin-1-like [Micropterus dolomieu]XP_045900685.1 ataxin-1-like [Micropterus dolomieu]XP_045900686.1 ataxin-1-like [Micropterus dolomieu]XP_045900687.1 ataxin-1-like [Micropterus dolomieu]XP_045900688.1 ataxin-1-like [Micropterus dolomieu]XP_045900689.1 ataxin-1-like [Micropterus dolomieu]XP_045900690.1 ataxin-1-like [Micropterus dolomieu]
MKSNQERSNGCLPPKKREILALEQRPVAVTTATPPAAVVTDSPHTENLAWLASVASERCKSRDAESPRCPIISSTSSSPSTSIPSSATPLSAVPLASLPAVYPTALPQQAGTIQFAQLGPNVQFISSGPYAGYISSHIISTNAGSAPNSSAIGQRPHLDGYTTALISPNTKGEQQQFQIGLSPTELAPVSLPSSPHVTSQYIHLDSRTPLTVSGNTVTSQTAHLQLHPHTAVLPQTLTLTPSQLVVQYADGSLGKKPEGHAKGMLNGEFEMVKQTKTPSHPANHQQIHSYEARHILLPADYGQNPAGLQTSLVLVAQPNHGAEREAGSNKISLVQTEKGGICLGKPVSRSSSFTSLSSSEVVKSVAPHTVIQTTLASEELPASLYSSTQPPIIGYITSANQHAVSYHAALPQHLVIPSGQSLLIPVSGTSNSTEIEVSRSVNAMTATTTPQISTAMPHAYLATALSKCEALGSDGNQPPPAVAQAPALPVLPSIPGPTVVSAPSPTPASVPTPAPVSIQASPTVSSSSSPVALPPFFMRGSIIQLADGELKRVEDLKTEDFIQSAEISSELKIDSSTVERIDSGQSPNAVVIQFSVGELKAQVCVEVLVEYPFFVFGQGWSSCCPDRTTQLFELSCAKLCVGDVCVSLTLRGLRNGSVTDSQACGTKLKTGHPSDIHSVDATVRNSMSPNAAGSNSGLLMKASSADRLEREQVTGPGPGLELPPGLGLVPGQGEGIYGAGPVLTVSGTGEVRQEAVKTDIPALTKIQCGDPERPTGRKRRWSAPERDQTERAEEEPPLTLPKPSFIPQEVKICIEGHSSAGSERCLNKRVDC